MTKKELIAKLNELWKIKTAREMRELTAVSDRTVRRWINGEHEMSDSLKKLIELRLK